MNQVYNKKSCTVFVKKSVQSPYKICGSDAVFINLSTDNNDT